MNTIKRNFEIVNQPLIKDLPQYNKLKIEYILYLDTNRRMDIMNILSIFDKFFCDLLVKHEKIKDDSYDYIPQVTFNYGGKSFKKRIEIYLSEIENA